MRNFFVILSESITFRSLLFFKENSIRKSKASAIKDLAASQVFLIVTILVGISIFATGCSSNSGSSADGSGNNESGNNEVTLSLYSTMGLEHEKNAFKSVIADFEKEYPDINIETNFPAGEYEGILRVKMAANDMPDIFDTHGWAKIRYGEYVADLSDMNWVQNLDPAMEPILKDEQGKVYAYPLNQAKDGITYNVDILKKYDIEPPTTFAEFMTALETVKEKSNGEVVPLWIPAGESGPIGQYFDQFATPLLITDEENSYGEELKNGTFDWSHYTFLPKKLKEMQEKDLLNEDILTAKEAQGPRLMAQGKIAFTFLNGAMGPNATKLNPEVKVGVFPMPAIHEGDKPSFIGGERFTLAAWKDSKHLKEAKLFIEFVSQPKYVKKLAEATSLPAGLTNVEVENYYSEFYKDFSDIKVRPYFDRVYLPSGMWSVMNKTGQELLADIKTPEEVSKEMGKEYERLRKQK
jgi:raffinose/stachyose/melibiose transport system substrate-binding protein